MTLLSAGFYKALQTITGMEGIVACSWAAALNTEVSGKQASENGPPLTLLHPLSLSTITIDSIIISNSTDVSTDSVRLSTPSHHVASTMQIDAWSMRDLFGHLYSAIYFQGNLITLTQ
jgi:hypothetical protein